MRLGGLQDPAHGLLLRESHVDAELVRQPPGNSVSGQDGAVARLAVDGEVRVVETANVVQGGADRFVWADGEDVHEAKYSQSSRRRLDLIAELLDLIDDFLDRLRDREAAEDDRG